MDRLIRRISRRLRTSSTLAYLLLACLPSGVLAKVIPNALFTDHAVLQQGVAIPVWGTADAGEAVSVSLGLETQKAKADSKGRWSVKLESREAGGPHTLTIEGENKIVLSNVLIGEVWVCSGQSNMAWSVRRSNKPGTEIASADWPNIRLFSVKRTVAGEPLTNVTGSWAECSPESIPNFSAVAYYFGRDIHQMVDVPVGLIHTSWGGTPSDAWTKREALESTGSLYEDRFKQWADAIEAYGVTHAEYVKKHKTWEVTRDYLQSIKAEKIPRAPRAPRGPKHPHRPAGLYNGMIAPLIPYAIKGAIWYQGESNAGRAYQYRTLFPLMIQNWRDDWGQGDFPFYFVQLANYKKIKDEPADSDWAELREAQSMTLKLANTGQAVIIDIGEADNIHPKNKQDVGRRLARLALANTYGREITGSGPIYTGMKVKSGKVTLSFDHAEPGLVAPEGKLKGFAIAGKDSQFVWADAAIEGKHVVVWSDSVKKPVAVRYGWADNPVCNLYNRVGLPASPFRTDSWDGITIGKN